VFAQTLSEPSCEQLGTWHLKSNWIGFHLTVMDDLVRIILYVGIDEEFSEIIERVRVRIPLENLPA
jgi:hypothetical protein